MNEKWRKKGKSPSQSLERPPTQGLERALSQTFTKPSNLNSSISSSPSRSFDKPEQPFSLEATGVAVEKIVTSIITTSSDKKSKGRIDYDRAGKRDSGEFMSGDERKKIKDDKGRLSGELRGINASLR